MNQLFRTANKLFRTAIRPLYQQRRGIYTRIDDDIEKEISSKMSPTHQSSHFVYGTLLKEKRFMTKAETYLNKSQKDLKFCFTSGTDVVGHPGCLHGGIIALLFDHAMFLGVQYLINSSIHPYFTGRLEIDYRSIVRTNKSYETIISIESTIGRKVWLRGELVGVKDREIVAKSRALFVRPKEE